MTKNHAVHVLKEELARRTSQNSRYSLRAFAKLLKVHPSALSRILSEKQPLSLKTAVGVAKQLRLDQNQKLSFLLSVIDEKRNYEFSKLKDLFDEALNEVRDLPEERSEFSMTVWADPAKVGEARSRIAKFLESLNAFLGDGATSQFYQIAVQIFPLRAQEAPK